MSLRDAPDAKVILIGTGSEVELAIKRRLSNLDAKALHRVWCPCRLLMFRSSGCAVQSAYMPRDCPACAKPRAWTDFWRKYVGLDGAVIGIDSLAQSAPASALFKYLHLPRQ